MPAVAELGPPFQRSLGLLTGDGKAAIAGSAFTPLAICKAKNKLKQQTVLRFMRFPHPRERASMR
jgi:hypothetical protein